MGMLLSSENAEHLTLYLDKKDEKPTLEKCQEFVGGYIEIIPSKDGKKQIIVDEEGMLKGKPVNEDATEEFGMLLVGDIMVLSGEARLD
jgi:hypothetical protein|tara:strand:+ start:2262 stop:2528 length:267 start_codon:yes stop_codon:yes gene_type:complete